MSERKMMIFVQECDPRYCSGYTWDAWCPFLHEGKNHGMGKTREEAISAIKKQLVAQFDYWKFGKDFECIEF